MKNRIAVIVLCGFLFGSLSFNAIQQEELVEKRRQSEFDTHHYTRLITLAHESEIWRAAKESD